MREGWSVTLSGNLLELGLESHMKLRMRRRYVWHDCEKVFVDTLRGSSVCA